MGDPFKRVQPGDPLKIQAETFNTFIDAAQDFKARTRGFSQKATAQAPQRTIIPVKNMSGADRERFDVLEISQPLFDLDSDAGKERPMANGEKPGGPSGRIAVLLEPAKVGEIARACVSGVTVARVKLVEKWHKWVDLKKDECQFLESRVEPGGGYILWSNGQAGTQSVLLKISNPPPIHFPARITSVTWETGGRYKYGFQEVLKKAKEWDGWKPKASEDGGRSGTAYNLIETVNNGTCVPAKVNETVWMEEVHFTGEDGEEKIEYWFQYEEYDQDASSGYSSGASSGGGGLGGPVDLDVMVCGAWNRCGKYIVIPQKRLAFDARGNLTGITTIANDVIPIYVCESSGWESSDYKPPPPPPPESSGSSAGGQFATDPNCYLCLKGSVPARLWVTIDNMLDRDCPECLQQQIYEYAVPLGRDPFICYWETWIHPLCSHPAHLGIVLYESGGRVKLLGELTVAEAPYLAQWEGDLGGPPIDCSAINVWLDFSTQQGTLCDAALSRLRVRAH